MQKIRVKPNTLSCLKLAIRFFLRTLIFIIFALIVYNIFSNLYIIYKNWDRRKFSAEFKNLHYNYWLDVPKVMPCDSETKLFILILSRRETYINRHAIRTTWFNDRVNGTVLRFFLSDENPEKSHFGDYFMRSNQTEALNKYILEEFDYYGDTVFLNGIPDTYANLHIMMHAAFTWQQEFCPQAKYVLKTDDDTVVHLGRLDHWIKRKFDVELKNKNQATCFGCPVINSKPIRQEYHRWYVPKEIYPNATYPYYIQGCTYLCSSKAINQIMANCPKVNAVNMEDVLYTGIVAEKANVSRSDQRWHFYWGGPHFAKETYCHEGVPYITAVFSYLNSLEMFKSLYSNLTSVTCKEEKTTTIKYKNQNTFN